MTRSDQRILVFERRLLDDIGNFQGVTFETQKYLDVILSLSNNKFIKRAQAELDTNYKQIIPYIMLKYKDSVFTYVRGNGSREKRLKMKYSIGLGGHIEDNKDRNLFTLENSFAYYFHAAEREIQEEVNLNSSYDDKIVALINDDSNEVGKVHFGVCHIWELDKPEISPKETSISNGKFYKIEDLEMLTTNLENWSLFAKDILMNYI